MALSAKREALAAAGGYGASEVGTIAGLSRFQTPISIYESRVYGRPQETSLPAELGLLLEEPIAAKYHADTGLHLARCDALRHPVETFALAIATPDRIAFRAPHAPIEDVAQLEGAEHNVQIKTASMWDRKAWGAAGSDRIPDAYLAQVQWEMAVLGLNTTEVPVLFDRYEYAVFRVPFDSRIFEALYEMVARFHRDHVLARVPPPVDASEDWNDFLHRRFAQGKQVTRVEPGSPAEQGVLQYGRLKAQEKAIKAELKLLSNQIRGAVGDGHGLAGDFGVIKWHRKPAESVPDWEAIARAAVQAYGSRATEKLSELMAQHQKKKAPYDQLRAAWSDAVTFNDNDEEE